jgi:hypothetical protein
VAKRDRIGKPKPGSIRYEARERGVTEARIRKERAAARGKSNDAGRGHAKIAEGEWGFQLEKDFARFPRMTEKQQDAYLLRFAKVARAGKMSVHELWSLLVSPGKTK